MQQTYFSQSNFELKTDWNEFKTSVFDKSFQNMWNKKMEEGVFRYKLNKTKAKFLEGDLNLFAQLTIERALNKRPAALLNSVNQSFNANNFNFTKIKENEFMFQVTYNENENGLERSGNYIVINVSPLEFGHSLLLPSLYQRHPQVLTYSGIEFAVCTLLSNYHPGFRIGFNGLCAFASVNHLHFHAYYLNQRMLLETVGVEYLMGNCYVLERHPSKGYVFQITSAEDIVPIIRDVYRLTSLFIENQVAHNVLLTRGLRFDRADKCALTSERDCIRIYVWARTYSEEIKIMDQFNPAMCELFGHLLINTEEAYHTLTEAKVADILHDITNGPFIATKEKVRLLFQK